VRRFRVVAIYLLCCVLWGSTWSAIKVGLRDWQPLWFAGSRMLLAAVCLSPFVLQRWSQRPTRTLFGKMLGLGVLQIGLPYAMMFVAQEWLPASIAAVLFATFPVWLVLLARLTMRGEHLTPLKLLAVALGFGGVIVLQFPRLRGLSFGSNEMLGAGLVLGAAMLIALANVLIRKELSAANPMMVTFFQISSGAVVILALASFFEGPPVFPHGVRPYAVLGYLAVFGTALTYGCFFWLINRIPIAAIGIIPLLDTTVAVLLGAAFLDERITRYVLLGGGLILTAAALANRPAPAPEEGATEAG
jgi:drug/metabolite transporter (DMT)-like permease